MARMAPASAGWQVLFGKVWAGYSFDVEIPKTLNLQEAGYDNDRIHP